MFEYFMPVSMRTIRAFDAWRNSYIQAKQEWQKYCADVGASAFYSRAFQAPKLFSFVDPPDGWIECPWKRNYFSNGIADLPEPKNFDRLCASFGLPLSVKFGGRIVHFRKGNRLAYYPIWTIDSAIIIKGPSLSEYTSYPGNNCSIPVDFCVIPHQHFEYRMRMEKKNATEKR